MNIKRSVLELVGDTPLVRLNRVNDGGKAEVVGSWSPTTPLQA